MRISTGASMTLLLTSQTALAFVPPSPLALRPVGHRTPADVPRTSAVSLNGLPELQTPALLKEKLVDLIQFIDPINVKLTETFQATLHDFLDTLTKSANEIRQLAVAGSPVLDKLQELATAANVALETYLTQYPSLSSTYNTIEGQHQNLPALDSVPTSVVILLSSVATYSIVSSLLTIGQPPPPSKPYPMKRYNPAAARAYFDNKIHLVIKRGLEAATASLGFGLALMKDYASKDLDRNADQRALQLAKLLTRLGPSFIKIGQSLSIRTDLLPPAYVRGLKTLQDQCPPFDTKLAKQILEEQWGAPIDSVLSEISDVPIAAASLGQVYRARMKKNGQEVAIKVLRPNIEEQIALDMHILREIAPIMKRAFNLNTDLVGVVDTWGTGFIDELDYLSEARNAKEFMEGIQKTPLKDVVSAPPVVEDLSTDKVLTTEWIEGERLDRSTKDDVTVLCSIAMNTYLTMMLEIGTLHSDPHPGNLLRTTDGRLCILDWGMVTRLSSDLQLTLITHMAHLTSRDYEEIPRDLLLLGFIPEAKADLIADSGIVEVLADIYGAWTDGGGAAAINVNKVIGQLQDLTEKKGNLFQIPPYFAYIAKCFSVLEGIGLSNEPQYSIINECLPYISKRLLTDHNEATAAALSTFVFGAEKHNVDTRLVDYKRVKQLAEGFSSYSTSASGALLGRENLTRTELLETAAEQVMDLVFTEEETPLQNILLEQLAKIIGAGSRSLWDTAKAASGTLPSGRTVLGTLVDPLGLWRTSPLVRMNELDIKTVETTRELINLVRSQVRESNNPVFDLSTISRAEAAELAAILGRKVWERRSGVIKISNRLATQLLKLTAKKLESGNRDGIALPPSRQAQDQAMQRLPHDDAGTRSLNTRQRLSDYRATKSHSASRRLLDARQRLLDYETKEKAFTDDASITEP